MSTRHEASIRFNTCFNNRRGPIPAERFSQKSFPSLSLARARARAREI
jgi:hypothetical protein